MRERPTKGRAYFHVTDDVMDYAPVPVEKPKEGIIRWGKVEVQELFHTFQSFLQLPSEYSIIGVYFDPLPRWWQIVIESDAILLPPPNEMIPLLYPSWQLIDGRAQFIDMNIPDRWRYYAGEKSTS